MFMHRIFSKVFILNLVTAYNNLSLCLNKNENKLLNKQPKKYIYSQ